MKDSNMLVCYNCKQVVANLSFLQMKKLEGINFMCDCCGHLNMISSCKMDRGVSTDSTLGIYNIFEVVL